MQKLICLAVLLAALSLPAQNFTRRAHDYSALQQDAAGCNQDLRKKLETAVVAIAQNDSEHAVNISKSVYDTDKSCPEIYEVYGESLFRNGKQLEGIAIIDDGIDKFGSNLGLIESRSAMSIELYEVGTGRKNIDGNAVYNSGNKLPFDEDQFKRENLLSAQHDLEYLHKRLPDSLGQAYTLGRVYTINGEFKKARAIFEKLKRNDEFRYGASMNIADILIGEKSYDAAIAELEPLTINFPKGEHAYSKMSEVYKLMGNNEMANEYNKKAAFYQYMPESTSLGYSPANYELLELFAGNKPSEEKFLKLEEISKAGNQSVTADVCLMILKLHANHGNGLEEEAVKKLTAIGKPAIGKVNQLFLDNISTCTVSGLADIMATVKDESSWQVMADYLPYMATMPMTVIPPDVPTQIIRFDNKRGTTEVLKVVRSLIEKEKNDEHLPFSAYTFYASLKAVKEKDVLKSAREIGYDNSEMAFLKAKMNE